MAMAKQSNAGDSINGTIHQMQEEQEKPMFHDFLGTKAPVMIQAEAASPSPASAASGGGRSKPLTSPSDLGSVERRVGKHLDGVQFYGPRSDISGSYITDRLTGCKRSNSDSVFMGQESLENPHLTKMLRNGPRSFSTNINPMVQYPSRGGQFAQFVHQLSSKRFKDANAGPSTISQTAADEGSRTGIKGPRILNSATPENNLSTIMPCGRRLDSSTRQSQQDLASDSRQMTIFYGGQAHVFDDVHPKKADVIIALAGSNGGSWTTSYSPKPTSKLPDDGYKNGEESEKGGVGNMSITQDFRGGLFVTGNSPSQGNGSSGQIVTRADNLGGGGGSITIAQDTKNPVQAMEPGNEGR